MHLLERETTDLHVESGAAGSSWFAVHTRARHEKKVAKVLAERQVASFVPTLKCMHVWSDRKKLIDTPLFSCYVFVRAAEWREANMTVLTTPGVLNWVGTHGEPSAIPDCQMDAVRSIVNSNVKASPHPFIRSGQRVRIRGGCLDGISGIFVAESGGRVVVSVDLIQQSLAINLQGYEVVPI